MHRDKPKLLVILGAGSSIPCGMPSVHAIGELMKCWAHEWALEPPCDTLGDVFSVLWKVTSDYYDSNHYCIGPNYERILGTMTTLAHWLSAPPFGTPLTGVVKNGKPISDLEWLLSCSNEHAARIRVLDQYNFLFGHLASYMRERSKELDSTLITFSRYKSILEKLRENFDLGIYNLNYDTVASTAWPEAFNGFDNQGFFEPLSVSQRPEWGFIYHIHGSVHYCISDPVVRPWIVWRDDLKSHYSVCGVPQSDMAQNFRPIPLTTLITGGFKQEQILAEPYQTFYSTLVRHVHEANAILIVGYGFGDAHMNQVLSNRFQLPDEYSPYPKVVVLEKSREDRYRTAHLESHEYRSCEMTHVLNTSFASPGKPSPKEYRTVKELIQDGHFERDGQNRVALWHGGFPEALCAVDEIIDFLLTE